MMSLLPVLFAESVDFEIAHFSYVVDLLVPLHNHLLRIIFNLLETITSTKVSRHIVGTVGCRIKHESVSCQYLALGGGLDRLTHVPTQY